MREATTQQEFAELSKLGDWFYVTSGSWVACGSSHVVAYSPMVSIVAKSSSSVLEGGRILGNKPLSPSEWLAACSVKIKRGNAILFKGS